MTKITFLGAGSTVFAKNLLGDIFQFPEFTGVEISLHDIDEKRLKTTEALANRLASALSVHPKITATTNRRAALEGSDYALSMFQIGGYKPGTVVDFEVPKKYGLRQTIADTLGVGGIMRALRTIPVMLDMCQDMEEVCPEVTFLNYVNPMAMLCWAVNRATKIKNVGLCHSVQGTAEQLAHDIQVPIEEINYICAGINHMAFYLRFEQKKPGGEIVDLYPRIRQVIEEDRVPDWNRVRYEMFRRLGYFVTESSEHFAEYTPYFIKHDRPDLIEKFNVPLDEYIHRCEYQIAGWNFMQAMLDQPDSYTPRTLRQAAIDQGYDTWFADNLVREVERLNTPTRSHEYGSLIIHSLETGKPRVIYGNVVNQGIITNLPEGCTVEVPCLVDKNGIQPTLVGDIPPQLAALMQTNINVQALTVEAALTQKREHIYHAAMLDPHTAAELDLDQIWQLVDEMIEAHNGWLPVYS